MSKLSIIYDAAVTVEQELRRVAEGTQVYLSSPMLMAIVEENPGLVNHRAGRIKSSSNSLRPSEFSDAYDSNEYETTRILESNGLYLIEDTEIEDERVILFHSGALYSHSEVLNGQQMLKRTPAFRELWISLADSEEDLTCMNCGDDLEDWVEGDEGEPYCTLDCLLESYN